MPFLLKSSIKDHHTAFISNLPNMNHLPPSEKKKNRPNLTINIGSVLAPPEHHKPTTLQRSDFLGIEDIVVKGNGRKDDRSDCMSSWDILRGQVHRKLVPMTNTTGQNGQLFRACDSAEKNCPYVVKSITHLRSRNAADRRMEKISTVAHINRAKEIVKAQQRAAEAGISPAIVSHFVCLQEDSAVIYMAMENLVGYRTLYEMHEKKELTQTIVNRAAALVKKLHSLRVTQGDPNLGNFMFNAATDDMKIIDFDDGGVDHKSETEYAFDLDEFKGVLIFSGFDVGNF